MCVCVCVWDVDQGGRGLEVMVAWEGNVHPNGTKATWDGTGTGTIPPEKTLK